jgi:hypothetical protein
MTDVLPLAWDSPPGPGHWVHVVLDGRQAFARYDDPVVPHMRRLTKARLAKKEPKDADTAVVRAWLGACGLDLREPAHCR